LDGTLIRSDLLLESSLILLRRNPLLIVMFPLWLIRGRAVLKREIAQRVRLNPAALPYREEFIEFLRRESAGRRVFLSTGSDMLLAGPIARHLGIFEEVFASDGQTNLTGKRKLEILEKRFAATGFSYAGNDWVDLPIWRASESPIAIGASAPLVRHLTAQIPGARIFREPAAGWKDYVRLLRMHQWVKNLIVFVPLLTSHKIGNFHLVARSLWAFAAFCAAASLTYVLNDLWDLESDRLHPTKRRRPFASGALSIAMAAWLVPVLVATAVFCVIHAPGRLALVLATYIVVTTLYSASLKRHALLDVICLAGLYTLRILAGQEATGVAYSPWLMAFAMFLFFSLALVKRFSELHGLQSRTQNEAAGRGYFVGDLMPVAIFGIGSGMVAVLVLALYVNSTTVQGLYHRPFLLLLGCPLLLYWIGRIWLLAFRGQVHEDPIIFALRDSVSYVVGLLSLFLLALATFC
jgi:4-hydroxybenzoate polyprenyltransferase